MITVLCSCKAPIELPANSQSDFVCSIDDNILCENIKIKLFVFLKTKKYRAISAGERQVSYNKVFRSIVGLSL